MVIVLANTTAPRCRFSMHVQSIGVVEWFESSHKPAKSHSVEKHTNRVLIAPLTEVQPKH
jgi:hypothetical protein